MANDVPANAQTIWNYLIGQGLSTNAAAGIEGNIERESGGVPSAGIWPNNYGLIQWTPASSYFASPPSLQEQLPAIIKYIDANGSIADINKHASTPRQAALWFSQHYERPNAKVADNSLREQSAADTAKEAKSGKWATSSATLTGLNPNPFDLFGIPGTIAGGIGGDIASGITGAFSSFLQSLGIPSVKDLLQRLALILLGATLVIIGIHILAKSDTPGAQRIDLVDKGKDFANGKKSKGSGGGRGAAEKGAARTAATEATEVAAIA